MIDLLFVVLAKWDSLHVDIDRIEVALNLVFLPIFFWNSCTDEC